MNNYPISYNQNTQNTQNNLNTLNTQPIYNNNNNKKDNSIPPNGYFFTNSPQHGGKKSKRECDRNKANKILNEMIEAHQSKVRKRNNIEDSTSRYLLLFSVDMDFRKNICGLIGKLYKMRVAPERVNEKTIRHLVTHHKPIIDHLYKTYCNHNGI